MKINLNNKKFKSQSNSSNGEVSDETIFIYHQQDDMVWAEYSGGQILKGTLIGKIVDNHLEFVYQHINVDQEIMTGKCISHPEINLEGQLILNENWQWTCRDHSKGNSTLIEISTT